MCAQCIVGHGPVLGVGGVWPVCLVYCGSGSHDGVQKGTGEDVTHVQLCSWWWEVQACPAQAFWGGLPACPGQ